MKPSEPLRDVLRPVQAHFEIEEKTPYRLVILSFKTTEWHKIESKEHPSIDAATRHAQDYVWKNNDHEADYMVWFYDQGLRQWQAEYNNQLRFVLRRAAE